MLSNEDKQYESISIDDSISGRSRAVAAIFAFTLGWLGVHRFYAGKIGTGIIMVILTLTVFLWWISLIWSMVDFVLILLGSFTDKEGRKIVNWND